MALSPIVFQINGTRVQADVRADMTVLEWLRVDPQLRGSKEGCAEGDCGACSILLARPSDQKPDYQAANSCIMLMGQIEGCSLITVEGLADKSAASHPVQHEMAENGSSQCGFCTPGIVISLAGLLEDNNNPDDTQIHDALAGNLCRCTGYRPIVEAAKIAAAASAGRLAAIGGTGISPDDTASTVGIDASVFFRPKSVQELCQLKSEHPDAVLLAGGTDIALDVAQARQRWSRAIVTAGIAELSEITEHKNHICFGGAVTWQQALPVISKLYPSFGTLIRRFGSVQVRSMGTIAGNIANASPIGDGPPALMALGASVVLCSVDGQREVLLEDYFAGYRASVMADNEFISQIKLPRPKRDQHFRVYKISKRYDQDISTVCAAFSVTMAGDKVTAARIVYGGMAATSQRCPAAENALIGEKLSPDTARIMANAVGEHFSPLSDWRGSAEYRLHVAQNLCQRFVRDIAGEPVEVMAL